MSNLSYASEADKVLKLVDQNLTKVADQTYVADVTVIRDGKIIKSMKFKAMLKGLTMKKIIFTAPGDVKGMAILTTKEGLMYVYMPSYKRVRRVASHVRNQGFMGTDFSAEELSAASLSKGWNAKLKSQDSSNWYLTLTPKSDGF
jgi:hypothetical protein